MEVSILPTAIFVLIANFVVTLPIALALRKAHHGPWTTTLFPPTASALVFAFLAWWLQDAVHPMVVLMVSIPYLLFGLILSWACVIGKRPV